MSIVEQAENLTKERDTYRAALAQVKANIEYSYDPNVGPDSTSGWTNTTHRHGSAETAHLYSVVCIGLSKGEQYR